MRNAVLLAALSPLVMTACSGSGGLAPLGLDAGDDASTGATLDGLPVDGAAGDAIAGCTPACVSPMFCSAAGVCLAKGACALDADCPAGEQCVGDAGAKICQPGSACGSESAGATKIPSNLMIVLDRSCSMRQPPMAGGTQSKWQIAVAAIEKLTTTYAGQIRFGLDFLPSAAFRSDTANECKAGTITVPIADTSGATIATTLTAALTKTDPNYPSGPCVTPIDTGVAGASTDPALGDTSRPSYMMLITDGMQAGCSAGGGNAGTIKTLTDLAAKGVKTFVVGFGGAVSVTDLDSFATAGGEPASATSPKFYNATDAASLDAALAAIGGKSLSCVFSLSKTPPDPSKIYAFFDKMTDVPRDPTHADGWDYDPKTNTVTFYGADCTAIESGTVKQVDVVFGCDVLPK
jgi:hypothetical protein